MDPLLQYEHWKFHTEGSKQHLADTCWTTSDERGKCITFLVFCFLLQNHILTRLLNLEAAQQRVRHHAVRFAEAANQTCEQLMKQRQQLQQCSKNGSWHFNKHLTDFWTVKPPHTQNIYDTHKANASIFSLPNHLFTIYWKYVHDANPEGQITK